MRSVSLAAQKGGLARGGGGVKSIEPFNVDRSDSPYFHSGKIQPKGVGNG